MFPIHSDGHWSLVVISIKQRLIIMCDSILTSKMPIRCIDDTVSFLLYYYPDIPREEWRYDNLNIADRFQEVHRNLDCGFHILNFLHAALKNARIPRLHDAFNAFKLRTNRTILRLQNLNQT